MGENRLEEAEAHHVRDVLRLEAGTAVEIFDDGGTTASGVVSVCESGQVLVRVERMEASGGGAGELVIASAVPKAGRADWMIEKLSELGVARFIPLETERSVVHPEGKNKIERWQRLATEAAKQSRRRGVMVIEPLTCVDKVVGGLKDCAGACGWYLSTQGNTLPVGSAVARLARGTSLAAFIGPEGGWSERELELFEKAGLTAVGLTGTILRVETAAMAVAAIVESLQEGK